MTRPMLTTDQWRKLFTAYMRHVQRKEGTTFLFFERTRQDLIAAAGLQEHEEEINSAIEEGLE